MSYGLIYKVYIPSVRKNAYYLEIEKKDYTGECSTITGGEEPFVTTLDDDDYVYTPLRLSTAKLSVVGGDSLSSLFATAYQQYRVTLLKGGIPLWCGFIKPELYTQDYSTHTHEIEMDCLSAISTLEYVKYTQSDTSGLKFVSLKSLISRALTAANAWYGKVYIPHTFAASASDYGTNALMRDDCVISEQNFFDEENKPASYKDILEEICRFAHVTLYDDGGDLYFVDHDYTDAYDEWTLTDGTLVLTKANAKTIGIRSVQDIGFGGSGHSMDIIAGYNKASVKTSNYNNADKVFPDEDWDNLTALAIELSQCNIVQVVKSGSTSTYNKIVARGRCIWLTPSKWEPHVYQGTKITEDGVDMSTLKVANTGHSTTDYYYNNGNTIHEKVTEITDLTALISTWSGNRELGSYFGTDDNRTYPDSDIFETDKAFNSMVYGAFLGRYCNWSMNADYTDSITSYDYDNIMFIRKYSMIGDATDNGTLSPPHDGITFDPDKYNGLFNYKGHMPVAAYADGAIAINLQVVTTGQYQPLAVQGVAKNGFYYSNEKNTFAAGSKVTFTFVLRIGDTYWNGTEWTTTKSTFTTLSQEMKEAGSFTSLATNKTLKMPYNDLSGWVIETSGTLKGELYVELVDVSCNCAIKDFSMKFQLKDNFVSSDNSSDRVYTNVVNGDYINEMDEIEEKISSYNHDGLCYSKVLLGSDFIVDALYEGINKVTTRPENLLLRRIVNQYLYPKIKLTQVLMNDVSIPPIDKLTDTYQGTDKKFIVAGKETKYRSDTSEIKMIEKE